MATHEEMKAALFAEDPELAAAYAESEPAFLVAREVLKAREELRISQVELARRMGTSQSVISRLENMEGSPNLKTVLALASALDRRLELRFVARGAELAEVTRAEAADEVQSVEFELNELVRVAERLREALGQDAQKRTREQDAAVG
jgi:transcriptional regulator with XRE-family HTH domain